MTVNKKLAQGLWLTIDRQQLQGVFVKIGEVREKAICMQSRRNTQLRYVRE